MSWFDSTAVRRVAAGIGRCARLRKKNVMFVPAAKRVNILEREEQVHYPETKETKNSTKIDTGKVVVYDWPIP
jgi:hypothetical protein